MKKKYIALILASALALVLTLTACGKRIPAIADVIAGDDPFPQELLGFSRKALQRAWGEPGLSDGNCDTWDMDGRFVRVLYDADGKAETVNRSEEMTALVLGTEENGTVWITEVPKDGEEISLGGLITFRSGDLKPGDIVTMQFEGIVMETYPAQIGTPYSVEVTGTYADPAACEAALAAILDAFSES